MTVAAKDAQHTEGEKTPVPPKSAAAKPKVLAKTSDGIVFQLEEFTPQMANEARRQIRVQRREDKRAVETYANAMKRGAWIQNLQPIIFDQEGHVIDGYHRLTAIERSGETIKSLVARNIPRDVLHTIDQHRRRNYKGVLEARGIANAGTLVRLMGRLIRLENNVYGISTAQIGWSRLDRVLNANPELQEALRISKSYDKVSLLRDGIRVMMIFQALRAGRMEDLEKFMRDFNRNLDEDQASFRASRKFRTELVAHRELARRKAPKGSNASGLTEDEELGGAIMAFNDAFDGDKRSDSYLWAPDTGTMEIVDDARYEAAYEQALKKAVAAEKRRLRKEGRKDEIDDIDPSTLEFDFDPPKKRVPIPNQGMPVMNGYPGLREGRIADFKAGDEYEGQTAEELMEAHDHEPDDLAMKAVTLTPAMARKLMRFNKFNRKIQPSHVAMIARDIENGFWMFNAQPICFTHNPFAKDADERNTRLLNGQHRLEACIQADMPIEIMVGWNVPEEAFATYDVHAKRSQLASSSDGDERVLKAAAKFMWRVDNGHDVLAAITPSTTELSLTLQKHKSLVEKFPDARRLKDMGSAGVLTYILARAFEERPDYYKDFFDILETGTGIDKGNPIGRYRTDIVGARNAKAKRADVLRLYVQAWESYRDWRIEQDSKKGQ